jgi:hypothetical protein
VRRGASPSGKQLADGSRSILIEREGKKPVHSSTSAAGIAMGMVRLATLSTGKFIEPLNSFQKHQDRLLKAQAGFEPQAEVEQERATENRTQPGNPGPGLERIPPATGVQDALARRPVDPGSTRRDQRDLS